MSKTPREPGPDEKKLIHEERSTGEASHEGGTIKYGLRRLVREAALALVSAAVGAFLASVIALVLYMEARPDLEVWHVADLDQEFTAGSDTKTLLEYLALEDRLFAQLEEQVYARISSDQQRLLNRFAHGSLSDPNRWKRNWNRSFELVAQTPKAFVLLLHGMSDSPYSLRSLGERFNSVGATVLGLRIPGHGTAPSGLVEVSWKDMTAAVRLAMAYLAEHAGDRPIHIVGYSNGAALAVNYTLDSLQDPTLPRVERLVLLSPAIGVTSVAALAVWQARLGHLLGLEKLAWNAIQPEYDPYKYGSFAVNAGDLVYRLTNEIQTDLVRLGGNGRLGEFPPLLAFSSVVDATVSAPALVSGLFDRLPAGDRELVLFDINRFAEIDPIRKSDPGGVIGALRDDRDRAYALSLVTNENERSRQVVVWTRKPGESDAVDAHLGLSWPRDVYSLSHVALPFPPEDPLYGGRRESKGPGIHLGDTALRGEKGVLQIPASDLLRLRWNPFYSYVEDRILDFLRLKSTDPGRP